MTSEKATVTTTSSGFHAGNVSVRQRIFISADYITSLQNCHQQLNETKKIWNISDGLILTINHWCYSEFIFRTDREPRDQSVCFCIWLLMILVAHETWAAFVCFHHSQRNEVDKQLLARKRGSFKRLVRCWTFLALQDTFLEHVHFRSFLFCLRLIHSSRKMTGLLLPYFPEK